MWWVITGEKSGEISSLITHQFFRYCKSSFRLWSGIKSSNNINIISEYSFRYKKVHLKVFDMVIGKKSFPVPWFCKPTGPAPVACKTAGFISGIQKRAADPKKMGPEIPENPVCFCGLWIRKGWHAGPSLRFNFNKIVLYKCKIELQAQLWLYLFHGKISDLSKHQF